MTPAEIKAYRDAGFTLEQIIQIGEVQEAKHSEAAQKAAAKREATRQRQIRWRERNAVTRYVTHPPSKPNEINGHVTQPAKIDPIVREEVRNKERDYSDFGFMDDPSPSIARVTPAKAKSKAKLSATRLAADWQPPQEWLDIAAKIGLDEATARAEAENMRDWSLSAPGGAKIDWLAAWRNWCRRKLTEMPKVSAIQRQFGDKQPEKLTFGQRNLMRLKEAMANGEVRFGDAGCVDQGDGRGQAAGSGNVVPLALKSVVG